MLTITVKRQSYKDDTLACPVVISLWKMMISRSACDPLKEGTSNAARDVHGAFRRTPKFLSPESSKSRKTEIWINPKRDGSARASFKWCKMGTKRSSMSDVFKMWWRNFLLASHKRQINRSNSWWQDSRFWEDGKYELKSDINKKSL